MRVADGQIRRILAGCSASVARAVEYTADVAASQRAVAAMLEMTKLDIAAMERAYRNA